MSKHTPGPWIANEYCSIKSGERIITQVNHHMLNEERQANAHLIAAAPEMLEALRAISISEPDNEGDRWLTIKTGTGTASINAGKGGIVGQVLSLFKENLAQAIAKAEGRTE